MLETRFHTASGTLSVTDLMPVASEEEKRRHLLPDHEILRVVRCEEGELDVELIFDPRPRYGQPPTHVRHAGKLGLRVETGSGLLVLRCEGPFEKAVIGRTQARMRAGETCHMSLTFADEWPAVVPPLGAWIRFAHFGAQGGEEQASASRPAVV